MSILKVVAALLFSAAAATSLAADGLVSVKSPH